MRYQDDNPLVYSTDGGRKCPGCGQPPNQCQCKKRSSRASGDGVVRVRREIKGRKGKTVTSVRGVPVGDAELLNLASRLKKQCGCGGSVKEGVILIQGDRVQQVMDILSQDGFTVKKSGG